MARVLSRAGFHEGTVLHAHRAASGSLIAVFEQNGWAHMSNRCADLCAALDAREIVPTADVVRAAQALDRQAEDLHVDASGADPARPCDARAAADALDRAKCVRAFVNATLSK